MDTKSRAPASASSTTQNLDRLKAVKKGFTYEATPFDSGSGYFISGLDGDMLIRSKKDAELIAEALNFARRAKEILRAAEQLGAAAYEFSGAAM